jgi:hypothetical protein
MSTTLTLKITAMSPKVPKKRSTLHSMTTTSFIASGGIPLNESSLRSSIIKLIASVRLFRHSSIVLPCPLAPGISGQYAMYQSSSFSIIAVNSLCMLNNYTTKISDLTKLKGTQPFNALHGAKLYVYAHGWNRRICRHSGEHHPACE